jgi:putative endonuclease
MAQKDVLGEWGERVAGEFLEANGYTVLDRRWRTARGEIDIVARCGSTIAFIEVKTRRTARFGHPLESVTPVKLAKIRSLAGEWCLAHQHRASMVRIDAIGIIGDGVRIDSLDHRIAVIA